MQQMQQIQKRTVELTNKLKREQNMFIFIKYFKEWVVNSKL